MHLIFTVFAVNDNSAMKLAHLYVYKSLSKLLEDCLSVKIGILEKFFLLR